MSPRTRSVTEAASAIVPAAIHSVPLSTAGLPFRFALGQHGAHSLHVLFDAQRQSASIADLLEVHTTLEGGPPHHIHFDRSPEARYLARRFAQALPGAIKLRASAISPRLFNCAA